MKKPIITFFWLTLFSIAMGYLEGAVVIYLRKIYYPAGFNFPLVSMETPVEVIETLREAATIIMLLSIGFIAGKNLIQKFACFVFCFAIWDIFYYIFLKILTGWPETLMTWDILFLIPVPWAGPVITPVIVSLTMVFFAVSSVLLDERGYSAKMKLREFLIMTSGCFIIFLSFILDFVLQWWYGHHPQLVLTNYTPEKFNWLIFIVGEVVLLSGILLYCFRALKSDQI